MRIAHGVFVVALAVGCSSGKDPAASGPPASVERSRVSLAVGNVPADGVSPATITVTARDGDGAPIPGASVSLAYTGSATLPTSTETDASGTAVLLMTASAPTTGAVTAKVTTSETVVVAGAPPLTFHGCEGGTFVSGTCTPPAFVRLPPAQQTAFAGVNPMEFAVGDLDGNGLADVVVPDAPSHAFDVLLADGAGGFLHAGRRDDASGSLYGGVVADVTGDAVADFVTMAHPGSLLVFPGIGDGTFGASTSSAGSSARVQAASDLDGDGDLDIVTDAIGGVTAYLNAGDGTFGPGVRTGDATLFFTSKVTVGHLDGDGKPDVVLAYQSADLVQVRLGNGDGTFGAAVVVATGPQPSAVAIGDLDGDGLADLVTANYGATSSNASRTVSVTTGNGDGTFGPPTEFTTGANPRAVAVGDLDGDGHADVVTADSNGASVSVLFGTGSGGLEPPVAYDGGSIPWGVAIARVDANAAPDLLVLDYGRGAVSALLGQGGRSFSARRLAPAFDTMAVDIASGDVDGDGHVDVAAVAASEDVLLARGRGDGTFFAAAKFPAPGDPSGGRAVSTGDLDADGYDDVIVCNTVTDEVSILRGESGGGLGAAVAHPVGNGPYAAAVGDLDGDLLPDLVVANGAYDGGTVSVLLGQAEGALGTEVQHPAGTFPRAIALGDLDGDGNLDAVVGSIYPWELRSLRGDGNGGFAAPVTYPAGAGSNEAGVSQQIGVVLVDLDGDGDLDAAATDQAGNSVRVFLGLGDGTFAPSASYAVMPRPISLSSGDVDGDGHLDLVTADSNGTLSLVRGNGDGTFKSGFSTYAGPSPVAAIVADLDGDAFADVAVAFLSRLAVFRGSAAGLGGWIPVSMGPLPRVISAADLDGDQDVDLVTSSHETSTVAVAPGDGSGSFGQALTYDVAGYPIALAIADVNVDGMLDLVVTHGLWYVPQGLVGVLLGSGDGTFQAESTSDAGLDVGALAIGDVNGDGYPDAVVGGLQNARLLPGLGNGLFGSPISLPTVPPPADPPVGPSKCGAVSLADLNGDGDLDLVAVNYRTDPWIGEAVVLLGNGDGTFQQLTAYPATQPGRILVADLDGNGHPDVGVTSNTPVLTLLLGDGTGSFAREERRLAAAGGGAIAAGDLDLDGDLDLVTVGFGGAFGAHRNEGAAAFQPFSFLAPAQANDLVVADFDGDGRVDVALLTTAGAFPLLARAP